MKTNNEPGRIDLDPILLLEMNEIPWKVIDLYRNDSRYPNIGLFFSRAANYTSITVDDGELSPWVTWPSLHRGMGNKEHGIRNLGQDPRSFKGKAIWEEYLRLGHSIGICGSLQSWPPLDPGPGGFYIPDTFAHDERCIPAYVEPFQKFNLAQVRRNGRVVEGGGIGLDALPLLLSFPKIGIRAGTIARLIGQLTSERKRPHLKARRPIFQTVLLWDVFRKLYASGQPPAFATFFTNHVAGVMHRYFHHVFPEDFGDKYRSMPPIHKETMDFAMKLTDSMLGEAMSWAASRPNLKIAFATSMGQAAVQRERHEGIEASIPDVPALMSVCGLSKTQYKPLLAMVPQVAVEVGSDRARSELKSALENARTLSGKKFIQVEEIENTLSITIHTPKLQDARAGKFELSTSDGISRRVPWDMAGIRINEVEPGTAYHIPEGIFSVYSATVAPSNSRERIPACEIKAFLMRLAGLPGEETVRLHAKPHGEFRELVNKLDA